MGTEPLDRKLAAILYADVAEYSRLTGEVEERTHRALSAYLDAIATSNRTPQRRSAALRRRCGVGGVCQRGERADLRRGYPT